jgi:hypothetical protein
MLFAIRVKLLNYRYLVTLPKLCHATEKSEAIAKGKKMPVIPVIKVVDKKRIIGKK